VLSAALEVAPEGVGDCRQFYWEQTQRTPNLKAEQVRMQEYSAFKLVEYMVPESPIPEFSGTRVDQKNILACVSRDGFFAYVHLSKVHFRPEEIILFQAVLSTVSLMPTGLDRSISWRPFPAPGHGYLQLPLPSSWRTSMRLPSLDLPPTIELRAVHTNDFEILITVFWNQPAGKLNSLDDIRAAVERKGTELLPSAAEGSLRLEEISGPHLAGYMYSLTKRKPSSSEFKYFKQGVGKVGELILAFTISAHDQSSDVFGLALEALRNAQQTPAASIQALPD
jgi:hypothetical protein